MYYNLLTPDGLVLIIIDQTNQLRGPMNTATLYQCNMKVHMHSNKLTGHTAFRKT